MAQELKLAEPTDLLKLDLACGKNPKPGFEGVDFWYKDAKHVVNLLKFPWPWADNSVEELHCSHYMEHIPMCYVTSDGRFVDVPETPADKDLLCKFMDEAWRVLRHDGKFEVVVPCGRSNRGFQDPTHRRFFVAETFYYFNRDWRKQVNLDYYPVDCHYGFQVNHTMDAAMQALHPEAQARRFSESWNVIFDWIVKLVAIKS